MGRSDSSTLPSSRGQEMKREKVGPMAEQLDFLSVDALGNLAVKAEYRVNKKERPSIRTRTER